MTSIDDLFRKPNAPSSGALKRKFEAPDAHTAYKSVRLDEEPATNGASKYAAVVDEVDDDDLEAGPELPPDDDEEDEEGRFFGDGVSADTSNALQYLDEVDGEEEEFADEKLDSAWLKRLCVNFEKKVNKNAEMRARYESDPQKFMASEADLDAEVKTWSLIAEHPELYSELAKSGTVATLVNLLAHENADIAIGTLEIIAELLDEDVSVAPEAWAALVDALLEADLIPLLLSNLARLNEEEENDRSGVYHSLAIIEGLASQQSIAERVGTKGVLLWLCNRFKIPATVEWQNKQYATEVTQVLLQASKMLRERMIELDGVDLLLQLLASYRKRDPAKSSYEEEYFENLFDALTCLLEETDGKTKFVEAEGVELCLIMLKEGSMSKPRALRLLSHAASTDAGGSGASVVCSQIVEAAGLKVLFSTFMKKSDYSTIEHLLSIQASMLRNLPGDSTARIRLMAKYVEKNFEKADRLIHFRSLYTQRLQADDSSEFFEVCLQMIDVSLAWICAEDPAIRKHVSASLEIKTVESSLQAQLSDLAEVEDDTELQDTKEMLTTLVDALRIGA